MPCVAGHANSNSVPMCGVIMYSIVPVGVMSLSTTTKASRNFQVFFVRIDLRETNAHQPLARIVRAFLGIGGDRGRECCGNSQRDEITR